MGKTIILNLSALELKGDVLDVGENFGVIYKMIKDDEVACTIDYIGEDTSQLIGENKYDICTIFFQLSKSWNIVSKANLLYEITGYLKVGGELYIWDINKDIGQILNNKIRVLLKNNMEKEFDLKNINPLNKSDIDETESLIIDDYEVTEKKLWEDLYFIKARKR